MFKDHKNIVLQFSGGKDSLACLLLLKDELHKITVLWTDSGAAFPETYKQMEKVKEICPNFVVVKGNQPKQIEDHGYPVDILPMRNHKEIQFYTQQEKLPLQGFLQCCVNSLMLPMQDATKKLGATLIIRGQKFSDEQKSPVKSGDVIDGVEYFFPIENWSDEQVMKFVKDSDLMTDHYKDANTSLDCWSCTAYLKDNQWKLPYLKKHHPEKAIEVKKRLELIKVEIMKEMEFLHA